MSFCFTLFSLITISNVFLDCQCCPKRESTHTKRHIIQTQEKTFLFVRMKITSMRPTNRNTTAKKRNPRVSFPLKYRYLCKNINIQIQTVLMIRSGQTAQLNAIWFRIHEDARCVYVIEDVILSSQFQEIELKNVSLSSLNYL